MVDLRYLENYSKRVFLLAVSFVSGCFISPSELKLSNFNFRTLTNECENKFIFSLSTDSQTIDRLSKAYGQKYLNLDFLENQGKTSWCAAYATTAIIRYQTRKSFPTARQMMTTLYPSSSNLADESTSNIQCISYANSYGFHSISNRWGTATAEGTMLEINANRPYWVSALKQTRGKDRHAFVVRGYANFDFYKTISVWNPWSNSSYGYDLLDPSSHLISTHGVVFKQDSGLFSWHYL